MAANWTPDLIPAHHWRLIKRCSCGGTERWRYARRDDTTIELQILPTRHIFRLLQQGSLHIELPLSDLTTYLTQYETP